MKNALSGFVLDIFVFVFIVVCGSYFFKDFPFYFKLLIFVFAFFVVEFIVIFIRRASQNNSENRSFDEDC